MKKYRLPKKYIFVYLLEEVSYINNILNYINESSNYEIIYICNKNINIKGKRIEDVGPSEFLFILKNAEYIITNSFHGTAFSIIFEKKFWVIKHSKYNERIDNIIELINQKDKVIIQNGDFSNKMIDLTKLNKKNIENKIIESKDFIKSYIIMQEE